MEKHLPCHPIKGTESLSETTYFGKDWDNGECPKYQPKYIVSTG
jgi:hypothetical protein